MPLRVAIIGLGFMGRTHAGAYARAAAEGMEVEVVAVVDPNAAAILSELSKGAGASTGNIATGAAAIDQARVRTYAKPEEAFADPAVDAVSICTYTDTHAPLALAALEAGKHVLVEKPIALAPAAVAQLRDAARARRDLVAMPAMCMRFWPGWDWLRERIIDERFGAIKSLAITRLGGGPTWSPDFYKDVARSGGAFFDLHVHDTDFICHCLGRPTRVKASGTMNHIKTVYEFAALPGVHVAAEGGWTLQPGAPFQMRYAAQFENASADWDISRDPTLNFTQGSVTRPVQLPSHTGYDLEVRHFVQTCMTAYTGKPPRATMGDAAIVAEVMEQERLQLS